MKKLTLLAALCLLTFAPAAMATSLTLKGVTGTWTAAGPQTTTTALSGHTLGGYFAPDGVGTNVAGVDTNHLTWGEPDGQVRNTNYLKVDLPSWLGGSQELNGPQNFEYHGVRSSLMYDGAGTQSITSGAQLNLGMLSYENGKMALIDLEDIGFGFLKDLLGSDLALGQKFYGEDIDSATLKLTLDLAECADIDLLFNYTRTDEGDGGIFGLELTSDSITSNLNGQTQYVLDALDENGTYLITLSDFNGGKLSNVGEGTLATSGLTGSINWEYQPNEVAPTVPEPASLLLLGTGLGVLGLCAWRRKK